MCSDKDLNNAHICTLCFLAASSKNSCDFLDSMKISSVYGWPFMSLFPNLGTLRVIMNELVVFSSDWLF